MEVVQYPQYHRQIVEETVFNVLGSGLHKAMIAFMLLCVCHYNAFAAHHPSRPTPGHPRGVSGLHSGRTHSSMTDSDDESADFSTTMSDASEGTHVGGGNLTPPLGTPRQQADGVNPDEVEEHFSTCSNLDDEFFGEPNPMSTSRAISVPENTFEFLPHAPPGTNRSSNSSGSMQMFPTPQHRSPRVPTSKPSPATPPADVASIRLRLGLLNISQNVLQSMPGNHESHATAADTPVPPPHS